MIMDAADEQIGRGLPSYLSDFEGVLGTNREHIGRGQIDSGDILEYAPPAVPRREDR